MITDLAVPRLFHVTVVPVSGWPVTSEYLRISHGRTERPLDGGVSRDLLPVQAVGVDLGQHSDAVAEPPGNLRCREPPPRNGAIPAPGADRMHPELGGR
jgi:hypothetical protein